MWWIESTFMGNILKLYICWSLSYTLNIVLFTVLWSCESYWALVVRFFSILYFRISKETLDAHPLVGFISTVKLFVLKSFNKFSVAVPGFLLFSSTFWNSQSNFTSLEAKIKKNKTNYLFKFLRWSLINVILKNIRTIELILIVILITFRPICPPTFFNCYVKPLSRHRI